MKFPHSFETCFMELREGTSFSEATEQKCWNAEPLEYWKIKDVLQELTAFVYHQ